MFWEDRFSDVLCGGFAGLSAWFRPTLPFLALRCAVCSARGCGDGRREVEPLPRRCTLNLLGLFKLLFTSTIPEGRNGGRLAIWVRKFDYRDYINLRHDVLRVLSSPRTISRGLSGPIVCSDVLQCRCRLLRAVIAVSSPAPRAVLEQTSPSPRVDLALTSPWPRAAPSPLSSPWPRQAVFCAVQTWARL